MRDSLVEEALIEMYLAGVSVRRVEDITEALWGTRVSPSTVSDLNKKIYGTIEAWRNRPIEGEHPYVYLDGIVLKRRLGPAKCATCRCGRDGGNGDGYREILGICEGAKEDKAGWSAFLKHLKERGLNVLAGRHDVLTGVDRLEHGRDLPHPGRRHMTENVAVPVHNTPLPGGMERTRPRSQQGPNRHRI